MFSYQAEPALPKAGETAKQAKQAAWQNGSGRESCILVH